LPARGSGSDAGARAGLPDGGVAVDVGAGGGSVCAKAGPAMPVSATRTGSIQRAKSRAKGAPTIRRRCRQAPIGSLMRRHFRPSHRDSQGVSATHSLLDCEPSRPPRGSYAPVRTNAEPARVILAMVLGGLVSACSEEPARNVGGGAGVDAGAGSAAGGAGGSSGRGSSGAPSAGAGNGGDSTGGVPARGGSSGSSGSGMSGGSGNFGGASGSTNVGGTGGSDSGGTAGASGGGGEGPGGLTSFRLVVLGSSSAAGEGASSSSRGWVSLLSSSLDDVVLTEWRSNNLAQGG
jgi:hypothetical protein